MNTSIQLFKGRLGRDPELAYTTKLEPVCNFSVAINNENTDDQPSWRKVVVWGKQAELCKLYLKKGKEVFVQGQKQLKSFKNDEGVTKTYEEVMAKLVGFTNL